MHESTQQFEFVDYNATGSHTLLRAIADELVQQKYDLILTIGAQCSQAVYQAAQKNGSTTPEVFAVVDDPLSLGIVKSLDHSGTNVTGVLATRLYAQQIDALLHLKPTVKRILLVYNPAQGSGLQKDRTQIEKLLLERGLSLQTVEVAHHNEIAQKVPGFLSATDVVLVLMDNTVVSGIDTLVTLCNRYGVLLFASDLSSGDKGAALSFGAEDSEYGSIAADLALQIIVHKKEPSSIPLAHVLKQRIKINRNALAKQGLSLTDTQLNTIKKEGGIIL